MARIMTMPKFYIVYEASLQKIKNFAELQSETYLLKF